MKRLVIVAFVLLALGLAIHPSPLLAQTAAQEIPFDSVPIFSRCRRDSTSERMPESQ